MKERRRFERLETPFPVRYINKKASEDTEGIIEDISYAGARITLDNSLKTITSARLSLSILFPENTLKLSGKVMWSKKKGQGREFGLSFTDMPKANKEAAYERICQYYKDETIRKWWQPLFVLEK